MFKTLLYFLNVTNKPFSLVMNGNNAVANILARNITSILNVVVGNE